MSRVKDSTPHATRDCEHEHGKSYSAGMIASREPLIQTNAAHFHEGVVLVRNLDRMVQHFLFDICFPSLTMGLGRINLRDGQRDFIISV